MLHRFNFLFLAALCLAFVGIYGWGDFFKNGGELVNLDMIEASEDTKEMERKRDEEKKNEKEEDLEVVKPDGTKIRKKELEKQSDKKMEDLKMSESNRNLKGASFNALKFGKDGKPQDKHENHEPCSDEPVVPSAAPSSGNEVLPKRPEYNTIPPPLPSQKPSSDEPKNPKVPEHRRTLTPELPLDGPINGEEVLPKQPVIYSDALSSAKPLLPPLPFGNEKYPSEPEEIEDPIGNEDEDSTSSPLPPPKEEIGDAPSSAKPLLPPHANAKYPTEPKVIKAEDSTSSPPPPPGSTKGKCKLNFWQNLAKKLHVKKYDC
ncbi:hypothetical protein ACQ4LE_005398 [Meloidogyne hapla]|uniref:Pollen-specific leucine-rich repeat extensin-like protein 1 n=1 Tax=Meloidogyne hapla TaxID=6305 RepID=A0A1I8BD17_MELHA